MAKKDKPSKSAEPEDGIRLSAHPRAQRDIAMAKGWGGLGVFLLVVYLSKKAGVPTTDALLRGVAGGLVGMVLAWAVAVTVWRYLALAELERLRRRLVASMEAQAAQVQAQVDAEGHRPDARSGA